MDLIFTDPPYSEIELYGDLAKWGARKLKPGGSLVAYIGHLWLPEYLDVMRPHLKYIDQFTLVFPSGSYTRLHHLNVRNASQLVLWFVKPPFRKPEQSIIDVWVRGPAEKKWDGWQQHLDETVYYIDKLSKPGDLVVEPFCGSGTTVLAGRALGCHVIAAEFDPQVAEMASARLDSEEETARAAVLVRELHGQHEVDLDAEVTNKSTMTCSKAEEDEVVDA